MLVRADKTWARQTKKRQLSMSHVSCHPFNDVKAGTLKNLSDKLLEGTEDHSKMVVKQVPAYFEQLLWFCILHAKSVEFISINFAC